MRNFETLESFIHLRQALHPNSRGVFSNILRRIGISAKIISSQTDKAALADILGKDGVINVQGEQQMKLDALANTVFFHTFSWMPNVVGIASEEEEDIICFPKDEYKGQENYVILFDPLDGSSNIDSNINVGSIFSIYRTSSSNKCSLENFLKPGKDIVAAGYILYGAATMLVYSAGNGVHGFTLDRNIGEFILTHENMNLPETVHSLSYNYQNVEKWDNQIQEGLEKLISEYTKATGRYVGSLVADFHRILLSGGVFLYPSSKNRKGKLRLLYECAPLAYLAYHAGGHSLSGEGSTLDIVPQNIHERVGMIIGSKSAIKKIEKNINFV